MLKGHIFSQCAIATKTSFSSDRRAALLPCLPVSNNNCWILMFLKPGHDYERCHSRGLQKFQPPRLLWRAPKSRYTSFLPPLEIQPPGRLTVIPNTTQLSQEVLSKAWNQISQCWPCRIEVPWHRMFPADNPIWNVILAPVKHHPFLN